MLYARDKAKETFAHKAALKWYTGTLVQKKLYLYGGTCVSESSTTSQEVHRLSSTCVRCARVHAMRSMKLLVTLGESGGRGAIENRHRHSRMWVNATVDWGLKWAVVLREL